MSAMDMSSCLSCFLACQDGPNVIFLADDINVIVVFAGGMVEKRINTLPGLGRM